MFLISILSYYRYFLRGTGDGKLAVRSSWGRNNMIIIKFLRAEKKKKKKHPRLISQRISNGNVLCAFSRGNFLSTPESSSRDHFVRKRRIPCPRANDNRSPAGCATHNRLIDDVGRRPVRGALCPPTSVLLIAGRAREQYASSCAVGFSEIWRARRPGVADRYWIWPKCSRTTCGCMNSMMTKLIIKQKITYK